MNALGTAVAEISRFLYPVMGMRQFIWEEKGTPENGNGLESQAGSRCKALDWQSCPF